MSRLQDFKRFVTAAVLLSLCSAMFISPPTKARAANLSTTKISPDLRQLILSGNGDARVKVIVQSTPSSSPSLLGGLLDTVGGVLVGVLADLNIRIVDVQANDVEVLASDPNVRSTRLFAAQVTSLTLPVRNRFAFRKACSA